MTDVSIGREWLVIDDSRKHAVFADPEWKKSKGYIPRDVAEKLLDRPLGGNVWFTREEAAAMRDHPEWRTETP